MMACISDNFSETSRFPYAGLMIFRDQGRPAGDRLLATTHVFGPDLFINIPPLMAMSMERQCVAHATGSVQLSDDSFDSLLSFDHQDAAPRSGAFATPMLSSMLAAVTNPAAMAKRRFSIDRRRGHAPLDGVESSRTRTTCVRDGGKDLEITVVNHPKLGGVVVSELGKEGSAAAAGIHVGDHITHVCGIPAKHHAKAIRLADTACGGVSFTLGSETKKIVVDKSRGDVGITVVNNSSSVGLGVVVVGLVMFGAAEEAGVEVGHVIRSIDGELACDHERFIEMVDAADGRFELVVQISKLTQSNVMTQHLDAVPCDVVIV